MTTETIKKYKSKSLNNLRVIAQKYFNLFIRLRDTDENGIGTCISSDKYLKVPSENAHAGHFYSAGGYPNLRFNEDNCHLQGKSDNYFKSGNLLEYRKNLIKKIGIQKVEVLDMKAADYKRNGYKWDRFFLIETIEKYKIKSQELQKSKI